LAYLGVTIQGESEMTPRTRLVTVPYSHHSLRADTAGSVDWTDIDAMPSGFADGTDDVGTGDITDITAGTALNGGGSSGGVTLNLDTDISSDHTFNGTLSIGDSTFRTDNNGISIGYGGPPSIACLVRAERSYNTDLQRFGYYSKLTNQSTGWLHGAYLETNQSGPSGLAYGIINKVYGDGDSRYGLYCTASMNTNNYTGKSYGIAAIGKHGEEAYGIYATASEATTNYAGYFYGNVHVSGTLSKAGGSFKIDHPLDPENKYLQHSFIESPDMMNIYNGNVITDNNGYATVIMPDYFTVLNRDFRYQLTVIGDFAQAIVAEKIIGNQFVIRTDKPSIEVSWQVTGIRHDNWANDNRIEVEVDKRPKEIGTYLHPEAFGQPIEKDVNYEHNKMAEEQSENR